MKYFLPILFLYLSTPLFAQTTTLTNFEVTLIGPRNTDRHHPEQVKYYLDYFLYLDEEIDIWIKELESELRGIRKRNKRRIDRKKPIKTKDYPKWKKNNQIVESLKEDKLLVENYTKYWENYDIVAPDSVTTVFMEIFDENLCYDLISEEIVLAPKEYKISLFEPDNGFFTWREFVPRTTYRCPQEYLGMGKTCAKLLELEISKKEKPTFLIQNLLTDLPFHLDGFKRITCNAGQE